MRVVLDTNVLIAALITRGVCSDLLEHCFRRHEIVLSEFIWMNSAGICIDSVTLPQKWVRPKSCCGGRQLLSCRFRWSHRFAGMRMT